MVILFSWNSTTSELDPNQTHFLCQMQYTLFCIILGAWRMNLFSVKADGTQSTNLKRRSRSKKKTLLMALTLISSRCIKK